MKKVAFYTLGCKVNQYETEAMLELFEKEGYEKAETEDYADVYVCLLYTSDAADD